MVLGDHWRPKFAIADLNVVVLHYAGVPATGSLAQTCRGWRSATKDPFLWENLYDSTQRGEADVLELRSHIDRPFGAACVGWTVQVLQDADPVDPLAWRSGIIASYEEAWDRFLVQYDGGEEVWEREPRTLVGDNPSLAGKSRFYFVQAPTSAEQQSEGGRAASLASLPRSEDFRSELQKNVERVPLNVRSRLKTHRDEVLHCAFSPDGLWLATASRDGSAAVYSIDAPEPLPFSMMQPGDTEFSVYSCDFVDQDSEDAARFRLVILIATSARADGHRLPPVCRVVWSPNSKILTICRERIDEHAQAPSSTLVAMPEFEGAAYAREPRILCNLTNNPYDLYAAFLRCSLFSENLQVICGAGVHMRHEGYTQRLAVYSFEAGDKLEHVAELIVALRSNYLHCIRGDGDTDVLIALTGSTVHICDQVAVFRVGDARPVPGLTRKYEFVPKIIDICSACVSVMLTPCQKFFFATTRPWVDMAKYWRFREEAEKAHRPEDTIGWPAPDIQTSVELHWYSVDLSASEIECAYIDKFCGAHAFTTKDSPFLLWADHSGAGDVPDYLACGGEDGFVYCWHVRQRRRIRAIHAHDEAVNCVSWHPTKPLIAACSDDFTTSLLYV
jgi:WD40 repeat protein